MSQKPLTNARDALDELLERAFRYAFSLTHERTKAEDLVQDASVAILARGLEWNLPYLFATIRNRFIDGHRRTQRLTFVPLDEGVVDGTDHLNQTADVWKNVQLAKALGRLRHDEREMLYLAVVEGFTAEEIAGISDRPRGTVLSLIFRAKRKLRAALDRPSAACGPLTPLAIRS